MADHSRNTSQSGNFEDDFRRMIVSGGPGQSASLFDSSPDRGSQPAVRLPPSTSTGAPARPAQFGGPPHLRNHQNQQSQYGNHFGPRHRNPNQNGSTPSPHRNGPYARQPYQQAPSNTVRQQQDYRVAPQQNSSPGPQQRARHQQQMQLDPNAFHRGSFDQPRGRGGRQQQLFNPHQPRAAIASPREQQHAIQAQYLDKIANTQISTIDMTPAEHHEKSNFHTALDAVIRQVCSEHPNRMPKTSLEAFGSFKSGFATAGSDMDLVIVVEDQSSSDAVFSLLEYDLPHVLEKRLLELGYGARLLTRTRVPIIKVCEKPDAELLEKLKEERQKWDDLPEEQKYPHLYPAPAEDGGPAAAESPVDVAVPATPADTPQPRSSQPNASDGTVNRQSQIDNGEAAQTDTVNGEPKPEPKQGQTESKQWTRERKAGPLDFPKHGVGIHSDINFFNPLGLHNTHLLRCYSLCDERVRPVTLFVKAWAKQRKINSSYSGTLSSYGYVLMVLHYLVNVTNPPVLPNLQADSTPLGRKLPDAQEVDGWQVRFWRDENEIAHALTSGIGTKNRESIGSLLTGFFHYYSSLGGGRSFHWMQEVLSLRSDGGILTKEEKGWVRAVTEEGEGKRVQHRYLFCIEDPFELSHNVARTVTHKGIVAIRDEFRRAHRILLAVGYGRVPAEGELCAELDESIEIATAPPQNRRSNGTHANGVAINSAPNQSPPSTTKANQGPHTPSQQSLSKTSPTAFPSLSSTATKSTPRKPPRPTQSQPRESQPRNPPREPGDSEDFSEISGAQARAVLEEVRRKRDEAMAERTARGAAESVLDGFD